jgi:hypothetical protein
MRRGTLVVLGLLLLPGGHPQAEMPWRVTTVTACQQVGVPASLALAVVAIESGGRPYAIRVNTGRGSASFPPTYAVAVQTVTAVPPGPSKAPWGPSGSRSTASPRRPSSLHRSMPWSAA